MSEIREIKFRGRRIDTGDWVYGHYFVAPLTDENSGAPSEAGWFFLSGSDQPKRHCIESDGCVYTVEESSIGQFIGRVDAQLIEIYEGDIFDSCSYPFMSEGKRNYRGVIEWDEVSCCFWYDLVVISDRVRGSACGSGMDQFPDDAIVIGSKALTPELLDENAES